MIDTTKPMFNEGQSELPDNAVGGIMTFDLNNKAAKEGVLIYPVTANGTIWNNARAVSAHYNANVCYEYFKNTFGRNSINV